MPTLPAQDGWWLLTSTTRPELHRLDLLDDPRFQLHAAANRPIYLTAGEAAVILEHPLPPGYSWSFVSPPKRGRGRGPTYSAR